LFFFFYLLPRCLKDSSGCTNFWTEQSFESLSAILFPGMPLSIETQYSPTMWWVKRSVNALWHSHTMTLYYPRW
jgi:hypothetical protein